jgi:hypothetical protein
MVDSGPVGPSSSTEDDSNISIYTLLVVVQWTKKCVQVQKDETWIRRLIRGTELDDTLVRKWDSIRNTFPFRQAQKVSLLVKFNYILNIRLHWNRL